MRVPIQIGSDWWDLAQRGPVFYSLLLMATQTEHLTPILFSLSPATSLGQRSHTLPLTLAFSTRLNPLTFPPLTLSTSSPLCVWNLLLSRSQPGPPKPRQQIGIAHTYTEALRSGCPHPAHSNEAAFRRLEKGWGEEAADIFIALKYITFLTTLHHHITHPLTLSGSFLNWI